MEGVGKHVVEMTDINNQGDREGSEAGLRLVDWEDISGWLEFSMKLKLGQFYWYR